MNTLSETNSKREKYWTFFTIFLLFVHYVRPWEFISVLTPLKLYIVTTVILFGYILTSGKECLQLGIAQMRWTWTFFILLFALFFMATNKGKAGVLSKDIFMFIAPMLSIMILTTSVEKLKFFTLWFVRIGIIIAVIGLLTHDGFHKGAMFGLGAFLTDPNDFSLYMNMILPFAIVFMLTAETKRMKWFYFGVILLLIFNVVTSFSRGGLVGLVAMAAAVCMFSQYKKQIIGIGTIIVFCVIMFAGATWKDEIASTADIKSSTAQTRITMWKASWLAFTDNPFGIGVNNTGSIVYKYAKQNKQRWMGDVSHSFWLTSLTETGIIGFFIIMYIIFYNITDSISLCRIKDKTKDEYFMKLFGMAGLASLVGFLASGTFLTVNYYPHFWYLTAFVAAGSKVYYNMKQSNTTGVVS